MPTTFMLHPCFPTMRVLQPILYELPAAKTTTQQAFSSPVEAFRGRDYSVASYYQQYLDYYNAQTWKGNYEAFLALYS